jgi:hypothetical protein
MIDVNLHSKFDLLKSCFGGCSEGVMRSFIGEEGEGAVKERRECGDTGDTEREQFCFVC